jgi:ABC-type branched-subunit amino acid transport system ATPase component
MSDATLAFDGVVCGYGDTLVVRSVSAQVRTGQVLGILGRNGVGKSTLMKALAGFIALSAGSVRWRGRDLGGIAPHARLDAGIAYAPQENVVFGDLSVADNLWLHLADRDPRRYAQAMAAFPRIQERLRQRAGSLSGGERKLLSFTRTLGLQAPMSLLDEPTEGVQPENIDRMTRLIDDARRAGRGFVIVEQNLRFIEQVADDVLVLDHGECVLAGPLAALGRERIERHLVV